MTMISFGYMHILFNTGSMTFCWLLIVFILFGDLLLYQYSKYALYLLKSQFT